MQINKKYLFILLKSRGNNTYFLFTDCIIYMLKFPHSILGTVFCFKVLSTYLESLNKPLAKPDSFTHFK